MKKQWQTGVYLILYILILVFMADFNVMLLLDLKSFFILLAGTFLLALPFYEKGMGKDEFLYIYGSKAIEAGLIQVFLLSFIRLSEDKGYESILKDVALCFRPMLYAFCIRLVLTREETYAYLAGRAEDKEKKESSEHYSEIPSHETCRAAGLTRRESEIAVLICRGYSNREIADDLVISETTVKKHVSNIFEKTEINRREELAAALKKKE